MRAWSNRRQGLPSEVLQLCSDYSKPLPTKATPIIVKVHAAALNPDGHVLMRVIPNFLLRRPRVPEIDFSGVIDPSSTLKGTSYQVGDEIYGQVLPSHWLKVGQGTLADYVAVSPAWVARKPDTLSHPEAASLPTVSICAWQLCKRVRRGERVFVNGGSGGVGLVLLQLLKQYKKAYVVSTCSEKSKGTVEKMQPDALIDYRAVGDLSAHLSEQYASSPFDVIIDLVGDRKLYRKSTSYVAQHGSFVAFGGGLGSASVLHLLNWLLSTLIVGYWPKILGGVSTKFAFVAVMKETETTEGLQAAEHLISEDSVFAFEDVQHAYEKIMSRRADGKVVVSVERPASGSSSRTAGAAFETS